MAAYHFSYAVQGNLLCFCMDASHICTHLHKLDMRANVTSLAPLMEVKLVDECVFAG